MGATLSLQAPHAQTVAIRSYVDVLQEYQFLDIINNTRFLKSIKAYEPRTQTIHVIKVFIKPPQTAIDLKPAIDEITTEAVRLSAYSNILPWNKIIETDSAGYLVRQMARTNLYDRLSMAPFLTPVEKLWFVYQLLRILAIVHEECGVVHGDLKTENVLVTGGNWLLLCDFSDHTKPRMLPENNPSEYAFYFDSSNRRTCYLAPERFYSASPPVEARSKPAQDLFSLGCVVMELYHNGEPTFTLSELYKYKKGDFRVNTQALPPPVQDLVASCLSLDPAERKSAHELLQSTQFPGFFDGFLYGFLYNLNTASQFESHDPNKSASDLRIEHIWAEYGNLAAALGVEYSACSTSSAFPHYRLGLAGMPQGYSIKTQPKPNDGCLLVLNTVLSLVSTLQRSDNKVKACELILALSEHVSDDAKLDRSLPYLCQYFDDFLLEISRTSDTQASDSAHFLGGCHASSRVASVALMCMTNLLETCTSVSSINVHVFSEYIVPKLRASAFMSSSAQEELDHVKKTLALCFPHLVKVAARFDGISRAKTEKSNSDTEITEITEAFLTSPNVDIRISLVNNLLPLCQYLGVDKTNDVILPHLITYLNDSSYQLRLAFLSSLIGIGNFIGVLAFEQYLIPLLLQTLGDHEVLVVLKALEIFIYFVQKKLIMAQFNALSIYKELLKSSLPLLLQPNEWIRQSVICLVLAVSENLSDADRFCFLYPLIKSYLSYDVSVVSWETLYPCLVKPLSHRVFDLSLTWFNKATPKSLFWKQKQVSVVKTNGKKKLVSYSKDMGKSVYIGSANYQAESSSSELPLSNEDRSWVLKLKSVGMDVKDLWKVFALKDFLAGTSRSKSYSETGQQRNFELASTMNIPPKTVFFDVRYKTEPISEKGTEIQQKESSRSASFVLPKKATASLQTSEANVFGEIDSPHDASAAHEEQSSGVTRMFSISNDKIITSTMRHNFSGSNPYILQYLENMKFNPSLDDFPEFGPIAKTPKDVQHAQAVQGKLVVRFRNNANSNSIEAVTKVAVAPFSEFFVTGSETGILRVWNASKVENLTANSARLVLDLGGAITEVTFMPQRFAFAAATNRGAIGIYKVHVVRGKNRKIIKYSKISQIRDFSLASGFATALKVVEWGEKTLLVALTTTCSIVGFDVITGKKEFELENQPVYGIPETFISTEDWLLLGTREGVLCLWDLRFQVMVNAWKFKMDQGEQAAVKQLTMLPKTEKKETLFAMVGGSDEPDVTVWEIPSFECRQVLSSSPTPKIKEYRLQKLDEDLTELFAEFNLDLEPPIKHANTCLVHTTGKDLNHLVTSTADKRVLVWDLANIQKSVSVCGESVFTRNQVSRDLSICYEKIETQSERIEDDINALGVLAKGQELVIVGDRSGCLSIFR